MKWLAWACALGLIAAPLVGAPPSADSDWPLHGRDAGEQRFSPLTAITPAKLGDLGLAWYQDFGLARGEEATPIEVGGVIYVSTAWNIVHAYDAATGAARWTYDPQVPRDTLVRACCDAVSRGVAVADGHVFVATLDGRLIALDAATGKALWSADTADATKGYTITGAPRVVKGLVIIGNGGAEMGVRGYVSAYDQATGHMAWRFFIVPGDPAKPAESPELARAMSSWSGAWWKGGGGGTAWDGMAYDPTLDLLYIGTGNGAPWARRVRSPAGGDNLYLSSIVALRPETGQYVWHYQVNPGDDWDYTATQPLMLADLNIAGHERHVIMQAPKNGFFYVLDRETGKLISAQNFVPVNWASRIDLVTGRPVENPAARYDETGVSEGVWPSSRGGHSWQPMAFDPGAGLVFIPAQETAQVFTLDKAFRRVAQGWNTAVSEEGHGQVALPPSRAYLLAWDPVQQRAAWRAPLNVSGGGALATAGGIVFQGDGQSHLVAYRSTTGARLWSYGVQGTAMAAPITYAVNGVQYVAVMVGCGGDFADQCAGSHGATHSTFLDRLMVFRLGADLKLPARPEPDHLAVAPGMVAIATPPAAILAGAKVYDRYCSACHGYHAVSSGLNPDLRMSAIVPTPTFEQVVLGGALKDQGMASFASELSKADVAAIRVYVAAQAKKVGPRG